MSRPIICDNCGKPTDKLVLKLFKANLTESAKKDHSQYAAHADIGECCAVEINKINWTPRKRGTRRGARQTS